VGRRLLAVTVDLPDEGVDVNDQPPVNGSGARLPRPAQRLGQQPVELADVPEGERAQERPQRRGRRHPPKQGPQAPGAQHVAVVNAVRAQRHRVDQRHDLASGVGRAGPVAEADETLCERLDS